MHESVVSGTTFEHIKPVERASFWSRARGRNAFALGSEVNIREMGQGWQGWLRKNAEYLGIEYCKYDLSMY
ncbi:hypothetical protein DER46DRAFT_143867 [Fusarium sp. MPI-SDFR-AT-0072]|nr:hypothetical protein DER46DRAFT_143867 [Fusarium sp. MPI-SDFR-AT-0072]